MFSNVRQLLCVLLVLALAGAGWAQPTDPYWDIISRGTSAQSETVQGNTGNVALDNTRAAYEMARGWNTAGKPLTFAQVQELNAAMRDGFSTRFGGAGGTLRTMQVVTPTSGGAERIVYPKSSAMTAESLKLDAYLKDISSRPLTRSQAITAAADVHSFIVQNHMFGDANGRTARMMADTILMRNGLPPADYGVLPSSVYNQDRAMPAADSKVAFRSAMDRAVTSSETKVASLPLSSVPAARPGQPLELLGTKAEAAPVPELTGRNIRAKSFSPLVGVGTAAGLHVAGELVQQGLSGNGLHPVDAVSSLASWEFVGGMAGFVAAERVAAMAIGSAIPIPIIGKLVGKPLAAAAIRGAAGAMGARVVGDLSTATPTDWKDVAGSSVASGVGMAVGQALIPIPIVGAVVGGVVGGLIWDVGYGMWKKKDEPPRPGLPPLRGAPAGFSTPKPGDPLR